MDVILSLGILEEKVFTFLKKLECECVEVSKLAELPELLSERVVDLFLLDINFGEDIEDFAAFLKSYDLSRDIPIIIRVDSMEQAQKINQMNFEKIEFVERAQSLGVLIGRIKTALRVRKLAGAKDLNSSLAETNAALRDLTARFQREMEEASRIQSSLMPVELPKDPRFEISIVYQPLQEVGGDWHYSSITKSGKLSLQILDVTGHGLDAALLGSMTRLALFVVDKESPDQLFHEMNRLMVPQLPSGRFVTAAAILFDPSNGEILFSRAGHPPGYILRGKSKEVETLQASGFALGFVDEAEYVVDKTILEPGDFVVLYTDGLVESQNRDNKLFGFDGLEASLRRCSEQMSVSELLAVLKEDLYNFLDGRLIKDDVTIIGLKRVC